MSKPLNHQTEYMRLVVAQAAMAPVNPFSVWANAFAVRDAHEREVLSIYAAAHAAVGMN